MDFVGVAHAASRSATPATKIDVGRFIFFPPLSYGNAQRKNHRREERASGGLPR